MARFLDIRQTVSYADDRLSAICNLSEQPHHF